jgi:hypothetical protein
MYLFFVALSLVVLSGLAFRVDALIKSTSATKPVTIEELILVILLLINHRLVVIIYNIGKQITVELSTGPATTSPWHTIRLQVSWLPTVTLPLQL